VPNNKPISVGILGKTYFDNIFFIKEIMPGETNETSESVQMLGGAYNLIRANIDGLKCTHYECGQKYATIINETESSRRTSFVYGDTNIIGEFIGLGKNDWLHLAYMDDINIDVLNKINFCDNISVDFCKAQTRKPFIDFMKKSSIIFDSRERKHLYQNVILDTPLILHDSNGCECIIKGKVSHSSEVKPRTGVSVNGAGDIFAGFFIREYIYGGLERAVSNTCNLTTSWLIEN
tara:strand:+ start:1658 stop:2359 length:702 start_codon:yes stop_codon:yes gene_type:complete